MADPNPRVYTHSDPRVAAFLNNYASLLDEEKAMHDQCPFCGAHFIVDVSRMGDSMRVVQERKLGNTTVGVGLAFDWLRPEKCNDVIPILRDALRKLAEANPPKRSIWPWRR